MSGALSPATTATPLVRALPGDEAWGTERVSALPAWPMYLLIAGFPIWWALGASAFGSIISAGIMAVLLLARRRASVVPGILPWFAFLAWVLAAAVTLNGMMQTVGYLQRLADLAAVGIALLYYVNARERLTAARMIDSFVLLWISIVGLALLAMRFPELRLTTPVSLLLPPDVRRNALVYELVYPRLAEVQQPWGAETPYNRPAAPFPYANSWGAAYAILTPVVLAFLSRRRRRMVRYGVIALLVVSVFPAVQTSNRGMFLALAISVGYVVIRLAFRGRALPALSALVAVGLAGGALLFSGAFRAILDRQQYSDSTGTRLDLYAATLQRTLDSPLIGWATPKDDPTIGYALGTQGYAWTLMFSYGFVGLALFLLFLYGAIGRTWAAPGTQSLWLHSVLITAVATMWFYGLGSIQLMSLALIAGVLLRARFRRERLP